MAWKKFNHRIAVPNKAHDTVTLTVSSSGARFTVRKWQGMQGKTHVLYHIDTENKRLGLQFLNVYDDNESDIAISYKMQDNNFHQVGMSCTKLLQTLPFPLVSMKPMRGGGLEFGTWHIKCYEEGGMIVMNSEENVE